MNGELGREDSQPVIVEEQSALAVIRLNCPQERNPLSAATLLELDAAFSALIVREDIKVIIFTGIGNAFASGANIRELQALTSCDAAKFATRGQRLFRKISVARQMTIAAINGYCMGGGLDLALSCDIRCASPDAVFAHPGARLGIITGWGGTQRLPALIGTTRALEMFMTGRRLSAVEALEAGLVTRVHDDSLACALEIAARQSRHVV